MEKHAGSGEEGPGAPTVHLVDDDVMVATALGRLLRSHGYEVVVHAQGQAFLDAWRPGPPACAIVDVAMPVMDGLALQGRLLEMAERPALIFLSGLGNVPMCATAMRRGAADFLTKPVDEGALLAALRLALEREAEAHAKRESRRTALERLASLTHREHQVLQLVADGRLNKQIAYQFGIAEKTVKVHRARGMEKMGLRSVAQLVRLLERNIPSGDDEASTLPAPLAGDELPVLLRPLPGTSPAPNGAAALDR